MANVFIRTSLAPYRIDTYNALSEKLNMRMCFYRRIALDQAFDPQWLESLCSFTPVYLKGIELGRSSRKLCFGIVRLLLKERPRIVVVPEFQLVLYQVLLVRFIFRLKFKIISMCDDSMDMIGNDNDFSGLHRRLRSFVPKLLDNLLLTTPAVCNWYKSRFGKGIWLPLINDGARLRETYHRLLPQAEALLQEYGLESAKTVLFVGRLVDIKNVQALLRAFGKVVQPAVLIVVGDGPMRGELEKLAGTIGKTVLFTGRLEGDALYSWYNVADLLVLPSLQEPFGAVTDEALEAGCRVIVSDRAGSSCLVGPSNGAVWKVDEGESSLASLIEEQLSAAGPRSYPLVLRQSGMVLNFDETMDRVDKEMES